MRQNEKPADLWAEIFRMVYISPWLIQKLPGEQQQLFWDKGHRQWDLLENVYGQYRYGQICKWFPIPWIPGPIITIKDEPTIKIHYNYKFITCHCYWMQLFQGVLLWNQLENKLIWFFYYWEHSVFLALYSN